MLPRLLRDSKIFGVLGVTALVVPCSVSAQEQALTLVANPAEFDFTPLELAELKLAEDPDSEQPPGTGNQPVTVSPAESKTQEEGSLAKAAQNPIASLISLPIQWNSTPNTQWAPNVTIPSPDPTNHRFLPGSRRIKRRMLSTFSPLFLLRSTMCSRW